MQSSVLCLEMLCDELKRHCDELTDCMYIGLNMGVIIHRGVPILAIGGGLVT